MMLTFKIVTGDIFILSVAETPGAVVASGWGVGAGSILSLDSVSPLVPRLEVSQSSMQSS